MEKPNLSFTFLRSKYRGCLLGALAGDCLGAPFEGEPYFANSPAMIAKYLADLKQMEPSERDIKLYTDDMAMTRSVMKCLIDKPEMNYSSLARMFTNEYFNEPGRGYGHHVATVFNNLKNSNFQDIFKPASQQFDGAGSLGNGGAMRISPVGLFYYDDEDLMMDVAINSTKITHTHPLGVNGALLQAIAVQQAVSLNPSLGNCMFLKDVMDKIKQVEMQQNANAGRNESSLPYHRKLKWAYNQLMEAYKGTQTDEVVIENLGTAVSALDSVPTAIYCFVKARNECRDPMDMFEMTLKNAISLGGDTDTIASMAGAICGAYVGEQYINMDLVKHCEAYKTIIEMADLLLTSKTGHA